MDTPMAADDVIFTGKDIMLEPSTCDMTKHVGQGFTWL